MSDPNIITPERLAEIEAEAYRAAERAWALGHASDGTVPLLCLALRAAWGERDTLSTYIERLEQDRAYSVNRFLLSDARIRPADELADAVEQFHEMSRSAAHDPARTADLAQATYRLGQALAAYRTAQKART